MSAQPKYLIDRIYEVAEPIFQEMVPGYITTGTYYCQIFNGHDGRIVLNVKPENEAVIHEIYVVYRKPTERDIQSAEEWRGERKLCGEESRCPPFLSTGRQVTTSAGNTCFLIQVGEGSWEARYLDRNGASYGRTQEDCLKNFDKYYKQGEKNNA